ncbi:MAG: hypothetical protein WD489_04760 [Rhodovibrionaceae bacterium]
MRRSLEDFLEDPSGAWLASLALLSPLLLLYLAQFLLTPGWIWPGGFLQPDHAALLAEAREYFDRGFSPLRALPFSDTRNAPQIYFEPLTLLLGALLACGGFDPGALNAAAGLILGLLCLRLALALYGALVGFATPGRRIGLLLFVWGGGLFALLGLAAGFGAPSRLADFAPGEALNLGRSLLSPEQAFLHAVFLGCLLALHRRRFFLALLLCLLLAASDASAGLQLLLVVLAWAGLERGFLGDRSLPAWFPATLGVFLALHLGYYYAYLPLTSWEHRMATAPAEPAQTLTLLSLLAAYALAGAAVVLRLRNRIHAAPVLGRASGRLLAVWLLVSFALANHEFLMPPRDPLRFAQGHLWMPLFLLGAPVLAALLDRLWAARGGWRAPAPLVLALVVTVFLFDNAAFLAQETRTILRGEGRAQSLARTQRQALAALESERFEGFLVATPEAPLGYMTTVYTPLRSWYSHDRQTPAAALRRERLEAFAARQIAPSEWLWDDVVVILKATPIEAGRLAWLRHGMSVEDAPGPYVFIVSPAR